MERKRVYSPQHEEASKYHGFIQGCLDLKLNGREIRESLEQFKHFDISYSSIRKYIQKYCIRSHSPHNNYYTLTGLCKRGHVMDETRAWTWDTHKGRYASYCRICHSESHRKRMQDPVKKKAHADYLKRWKRERARREKESEFNTYLK